MRKMRYSGTLLFILATFFLFLPLVAGDYYDSLVHYIPLDDSDGFTRDLNFVSQPFEVQPFTKGETGIINSSYNFTGGVLQWDLTTAPFFNTPVVTNYNFTYAVWFNKTGDVTDGDDLISENDFADASTRSELGLIQISTTATLRYLLTSDSSVNNFNILAPNVVNDSVWHLAVVTGNGSNISLYFDGVIVNSSTVNPSDPTTTTRTIIAGHNRGGFGIEVVFEGQLDEVLISNRTFSSTEILNLYNSGDGFPLRRITENRQPVVTPVISGTLTTFTINVTINTTAISNVAASLRYNNTLFVGTTNDFGAERIYSTSFNVPIVSTATNITLDWEFTLVDTDNNNLLYNATFLNQTINSLTIDNCTTNTFVLLNLTVVDEETQVAFAQGADDNVTIEVDLSINQGINFNQTFTELNPVAICIDNELIDSNARLDALIRYEAFDHVSEFVNLQNFTINSSSIPQNITLFDLAILDSQEFRVTFKDRNFLPVNKAIIDLTRKYIGEGVFKSVEAPLTDSFGQTVVHMVLTDVIYTIIVKKEGQILATFEDIQAICADLTIGECEINLNSFLTSRPFDDFFTASGLIFTIDYNDTTRLARSLFSTTDGSTALVSLNVTEFTSNSTIIEVCNNQLSSSSGVLSCNVPTSFDNTTIIVTVIKDGIFVGQAFFSISGQTPEDIFGESGFIILLIMVITLPLMVIVERVAVVIFALLGFIMAAILGIYSGGSILGWGSSIMWLIIASVIIIWKIGRVKT